MLHLNLKSRCDPRPSFCWAHRRSGPRAALCVCVCVCALRVYVARLPAPREWVGLCSTVCRGPAGRAGGRAGGGEARWLPQLALTPRAGPREACLPACLGPDGRVDPEGGWRRRVWTLGPEL